MPGFNCYERSGHLEPDIETRIVEREQQAIRGALRDRYGKHAGQAAPNCVVLIRVEEGVGQLADTLLGHLSQCNQRVIGHRIPRKQRNDVRDQTGGEIGIP